MLTVTFADLRFRARQFLIAVVGVSLTLSMALILSGLASGFRAEIANTVQLIGGTGWVQAQSAQGRITSFGVFPESAVVAVTREPGVRSAEPVLVVPSQVADIHGSTTSVNVIGVRSGSLGAPPVTNAHGFTAANQAIVNQKLGLGLGDHLILAKRTFVVVATVANASLLGGASDVFLPLASAQGAVLGGERLISAVVVTGHPAALPAGLTYRPDSQVITSSLTEMKSALSSIDNSRYLMWFIGVVIVAALLYVAALERRRDFAILKALGSSTAGLFLGLMIEAVVVTLFAALIAELIANVVGGLFSQPVDITTRAYETLPILAVSVGVISSLIALRRTVSADPASAFG